ncbi:hypothetical protein [Desulfosporosinus shakirovi]|uniref:hypothetical protein n=1 Tax=Desulfosporosinus shakirovi TaxID=2885154 RepID=UPI001E650DCD|nr:hypothetical protein [Desulfosporosinus sp. SRJS8]MCB8818350.1 hypothetical protein [Desulfosporosinus sp. SRJS8]
MSQNQIKSLTLTQLKQKLNELSKEEVIELFLETLRGDKEVRTFVSVKLQGEKAVLEIIKEYKEKIRKEFDPPRGAPKLRVATVKTAIADINKIARETEWPLELMVYFAEMAVQFIHEWGDISEDMGYYFTDTYEEIIQLLNKQKTPDLYDKYKGRLKKIMKTKNCGCWGIEDSLKGSYSVLKWVEQVYS